MGTLSYAGVDHQFDDRALAHLKVVITAKLRRGERFLLAWRVPPEEGSGRVSIWMSPSIPLFYRFSSPTPPALNRDWLNALSRSSQGPNGMFLMEEARAAEYLTQAGSPVGI